MNESPMPIEKSSSLPSIKILFSDSWSIFTKNILKLFLLNLIPFIILFIAILIPSFIAGFSLAQNKIFKELISSSSSSHVNPELISKLIAPFAPYLIIIGIIIIVFSFVSYVFSIAQILVINDEKLGVGSSLSKSVKLVIPLFLIGFVTFFLNFGALFLFIFPLLFTSFFLMFVGYEIILSGKKGLDSIRGSVQIASQHFGEIFIRIIAYFLIYLFLVVFIPNIIMKIEPETGTYLGVLRALGGSLIGWFGICFSVTMYKQAKEKTNFSKPQSLWWMWLIAILGWLIFAGSAYFGIQFLKSESFQKIINSAEKNIPTASEKDWVAIMKPEAKIHYEKSQELFKEIQANGTDAAKVTELNDKNITELKTSTEIDPKNAALWNNLGSAYTWMSTNGTLENSLEAYQEAEKLDPNNTEIINNVGMIFIRLEQFNEAVIQLQKSIRVNDNLALTYAMLGDAYSGLKMYSSATTNYEKAISIYEKYNSKGDYDKSILEIKKKIENLGKSPSTTQKNNNTQQTVTAAPSCQQFTIREGEFTSDKCYSDKDYADLSYYIQQFNSAVFDYNAAGSTMNVTCNGSEFFKNSCEEAKKERSDAEGKMNSYRSTIQGIIARGK